MISTRMKPIAAASQRYLIPFILILALLPATTISAGPAPQPIDYASPMASSQPQPLSVNSTGCQWTYYPISGGHLQAEQQLYNNPDNTPIVNLSLGNMFKGKATHLASTGSTDFNNDNKTDVFRTTPRNDGNLQWQYSSGGTGAWQDLAYAGPELPTSLLQFGDFSNDHVTDVFANVYSFPNYNWDYSPNGTNSFVNLHTTGYFADRLALGDFNSDGVTDIFTATQQSGNEQWGYYSGGTGSAINLAYAGTDPALLRFGDFNGGGTTDVFAAAQQPDGSTQWFYSSGGAASYSNLVTTTVPYSELQFGDFDGDGKTDVLAALPQNDGRLKVIFWSHGLGPIVTLGYIAAPAPALRVGDFNGDGISDLMALRCGMKGPLAFAPLQTLATSGYNLFLHQLSGDVNGDGRPDLILESTCQNQNSFGVCATHHLQVGSALGTITHTNTLVAPQQLSSMDFQYSKALAGDFTGDGKTDLVIIEATNTTLTLTVASSNGNGTFTLDSAQAFGGENWAVMNPLVGDFNGDGKMDLAFTSVCNTVSLNAGSCTNGDNNSVRIVSSNGNGSFSMGAHLDLGSATGWNSYYAFAGDFNGDSKTDLVFNSTCQKTNPIDSTCTAGDTNYVYTALSNGSGSFSLSSVQNYGSGWSDYPNSENLIGDINGDGRSDLVWSSVYQAAGHTHNNLVIVGLANSNGTFQIAPNQDFGDTWTGYPFLANLNRDNKADLIWNNAPLGDTDVDSYAAALSNGDGTFSSAGLGNVYTSQGSFSIPDYDAAGKVVNGLTLVSTRQNSISNALFVINGYWPTQFVYLPLIKK